MRSRATALVVEEDVTRRGLLLQSLEPRFSVVVAGGWTEARDIIAHGSVDIVVADVTLASDVDAQASRVTSDTFTADDTRNRRLGGGASAPRIVADLPDGILAQSPAMQEVVSIINRAARHDTAVLLVGESGTGKELLARALHRRSPRANGPFVAVNCSAIPETLLESELFGHRRGAFTDAREDQRGLFQAAHHGTLFLDEIGDMPSALQSKLLRVLQEKEVLPLGASGPVPVDVRVVTATHCDLHALVQQERFRQDLLYRINVVEVCVPPLRDRLEDLAPLVSHLLDKLGGRLGMPGSTISAEAMAVLTRYPWPGNVRELENVIERALVLGNGVVIGIEDLPERLTRGSAPTPRTSAGPRLVDVERDHIRRTLETVGGNKAAAARALDVSRKTLYRKLRQHRLSIAS
jgi:transcriptional regulator with PAS, ATPase and Fis domain